MSCKRNINSASSSLRLIKDSNQAANRNALLIAMGLRRDYVDENPNQTYSQYAQTHPFISIR